MVSQLRKKQSGVVTGNDRCARESESLLTLLPVLQALAVHLSPDLVNCMAGSNALGHPSSPGRGEGKPAPSIAHSERTAAVVGSGWPGRSGGATSTMFSKVDGQSTAPPFLLTETGAVEVIAAALPVMGSILGAEGDQLTCSTWGRRIGSVQGRIHLAAWRVLCVLSAQIRSAPVSTRHSERSGSLSHALPTGNGRTGLRSTDHGKHGITGRVQQWWDTTKAMLSVLFSEITRAQERLKELLHRRDAEKRVTKATGARRLIGGPTPLPFSTWSEFPEMVHDEEGGGFALTFWVWVPDGAHGQSGEACHVCVRGTKFSSGNDVASPLYRAVVYPRAPEATTVRRTCRYGRFGHPEVALTRLPPSEQRPNAGCAEELAGLFVDFTLLGQAADERSSPSNEPTNRGKCDSYATVDAAVHMRGRDNPPATSVFESAADVDTAGGTEKDSQACTVERLISDISIPAKNWVHISCLYSMEEKHGASSFGANGKVVSSDQPIAVISLNGRVVAKRVLHARSGDCKEQQGYGPQSIPTYGVIKYRGDRGNKKNDESRSVAANLLTSDLCNGDPLVVCDLLWHPRKISQEQTQILANNGIPQQRADEQRAAECYVNRLVYLAHDIASSSKRAAGALSSPRWLDTWLSLIPVVHQHAQRALVRLLYPLLCVVNPGANESAEGASMKTANMPAPDAPLAACYPPGCDFGERAVVDRLCALVGRSLIALQENSSHCCIGIRRPPLDRIFCQGSEIVRRSVTPLMQRRQPVIVSEIVFLLRALVRDMPSRWRPHIFAALSNGLSTAVTGLSTPLSNSHPLSDSGASDDCQSNADIDLYGHSAVRLGSAVLAAYLGGGHIEGPVGARVACRFRPSVCVAEGSTIPTGETAVTSKRRGTVVGWKGSEGDDVDIGHDRSTANGSDGMLLVAIDDDCLGCADEAPYHLPDQTLRCCLMAADSIDSAATPRTSRVVAVMPRQVVWEAAVMEPVTSFLLEEPALLVVRSLVASASNTRVGTPDSNPVLEQAEEINTSWASIITAHLRCRLIRALAVQFRHPPQVAAALCGGTLPPLLALAAANLPSAPMMALGPEGAVAFGRRRGFAAVVLSLDHGRGSASAQFLLSELQTACQVVWNRMSVDEADIMDSPKRWRGRGEGGQGVKVGSVHGFDDDNISSSPRSALKVLGGEALVEGNRVSASSHFPTIYLSNLGVDLRTGGGRWYYEVTLITGGLMQLGWAGPLFQYSPVRGQGVGDNMHSWAFDGFRQKRWCVSSAPYGNKWQAGDVVGVLLDAGLREMRFR